MIICICKNISDTTIKESINLGFTSLEDLQLVLDVCTNCECCKEEIKKLLEQYDNTYSFNR